MGLSFSLLASGYKSGMVPAARSVFERRLREAYDAEVRLGVALPDFARRAADQELAKAFLAHAKVTARQTDRLTKVFGHIGKQPRRRKCEVVGLLIDEANQGTTGGGSDKELDLDLIAAALLIEQVEAGLYKSLMKLAEAAGLKRPISKFEKSLGEEEHAVTELEDLLQSIGEGR
jgi:ferritin-like metal-binding protein YciE